MAENLRFLKIRNGYSEALLANCKGKGEIFYLGQDGHYGLARPEEVEKILYGHPTSTFGFEDLPDQRFSSLHDAMYWLEEKRKPMTKAA